MFNKNHKISWWNWIMNDEEAKYQVDNYNSLKLYQSYRGIAVLVVAASLLFALVLSFFDIQFELEDILYSLIIYIPILILVYRGKRWAIVVLMILYTFERLYQIFELNSVVAPIFWWLLIMPVFWKALKIESIRKKQTKIINENNYCNNCGEKIIPENKFCSKCGKKLTGSYNQKRKNNYIKIIISLAALLLIGVLSFYTFKDQDEHLNSDDNIEAETESLFSMFSPYLEPVGYFSQPEMYDKDIDSSEWLAYIHYYEKDNVKEENNYISNIPNQSDVLSAVVKVICEDEYSYFVGSGVNFDASGYAITNLHVVEDTDECAVGFANPKTGLIEEIYRATPIIDKENLSGHDLAYLSIEAPFFDEDLNIYGDYNKFYNANFPYFEITEKCLDREIQLGSPLFVIGYPNLSGGALTITDGLVSSLYSRDGYIITSAKINSGNSGGLAIDKEGCYIGVPTAVYYEDGEESFGEIIDAEFVAEFDEAVFDDLEEYFNNL